MGGEPGISAGGTVGGKIEFFVWRLLSGDALTAWPRQAIVATAHKIARTVYHLLKTGEPYREESDAEYNRKRQEREVKHLARRAQKLGYTLTAVPVTAPQSLSELAGEGSF